MDPDGYLGIELAILGFLIFSNGLFAMSELAILSARKSYLQKLADKGDLGANTALQLMRQSSELLSTIQIGITLVGFISGVYSGATLVKRMSATLTSLNFTETVAQSVSAATVIFGITFFSVVFGELIPKRIALHAPEQVARLTSRPVYLLSKLVSPVVSVLAWMTDLICRLIGIHDAAHMSEISGEEIKSLVQQSAQKGGFDETEQRMVEGVLNFSEARISSFMTPRPEVVWLDIEDSVDINRRKIIEARHSHFPVVKGSLDNVIGVIHVKDVLSRELQGQAFDQHCFSSRLSSCPKMPTHQGV